MAWDEEEWHVLPDNTATPKRSARPCGDCGGTVKVEVETLRRDKKDPNAPAWRTWALHCIKCLPPLEGQKTGKIMDVETWEVAVGVKMPRPAPQGPKPPASPAPPPPKKGKR